MVEVLKVREQDYERCRLGGGRKVEFVLGNAVC